MVNVKSTKSKNKFVDKIKKKIIKRAFVFLFKCFESELGAAHFDLFLSFLIAFSGETGTLLANIQTCCLLTTTLPSFVHVLNIFS